jgi:hypothetical protein
VSRCVGLSGSDRESPALTGRSGTQRARRLRSRTTVATSVPWSSSPPSELRITRVSRCVARGPKARASFMSAGWWWRRSLAVDGSSGTSRGHAPELRSPYKRPQRCCAAWRVTPSRACWCTACVPPASPSPSTQQRGSRTPGPTVAQPLQLDSITIRCPRPR